MILNIIINCCEYFLRLSSELLKVGSGEDVMEEINFTSILIHHWPVSLEGGTLNIPRHFDEQEEHVFQAL